MTITTAQMMVGPGRVRWAPVGTNDAAIVAAYAPNWAGWTDVGATDGGVDMSIVKDYENHGVDQTPDWVASTIKSRHTTLQTSLVESGDLAKIALVNNGGVMLSTNPSWTSYEPNTDLISTQETYIAVGVEGITLAGKKRLIIIRKVLNVDSIASSFKKDGKTMLAMSLAGHFVSDAIAPWIVYSQN